MVRMRRRLLRRPAFAEAIPAPLATRPGSRVELRDLVLADRDAFLEMVRESRDLHRPWTYPPERADQFNDLVSRTGRDDFVCLAAVLADNGELVGIFTSPRSCAGTSSRRTSATTRTPATPASG